jgi:hypothetical protein
VNILNKLKTPLLVMSVTLLPTVSYAMNSDLTQEQHDKAVKESLRNPAPLPMYDDDSLIDSE